MKRIYIFILACLVSSTMVAGVHTYATQSVLNTGTFVKVSVKESGVHSISYETLKSWGLKPENVAVLGYGGAVLTEDFTKHHWDDVPAVAFYMHKGSDGVFNAGDYILFYAQGATAWQFGQNGCNLWPARLLCQGVLQARILECIDQYWLPHPSRALYFLLP